VGGGDVGSTRGGGGNVGSIRGVGIWDTPEGVVGSIIPVYSLVSSHI